MLGEDRTNFVGDGLQHVHVRTGERLPPDFPEESITEKNSATPSSTLILS